MGVRMRAHAFNETAKGGGDNSACLLAKQNTIRFEVLCWYGGVVIVLKVKATHIEISQSHLS